MPRELTSHKVNGCNEALAITVADEPGSGGACHAYAIEGFNTKSNASCVTESTELCIAFQNGPIKEVGTNGVTHEALLAILEDRLCGFQSGPYATEDNAMALESIRNAMLFLQKRTKERLARGVEGTHAK